MATIRQSPSDPFSVAPVVMRSKNLRALTRYPRETRAHATRVTLETYSDGRTAINVDYADGSRGLGFFEDWRVARSWTLQRIAHNPWFRDAEWQHHRIIPTEHDNIIFHDETERG